MKKKLLIIVAVITYVHLDAAKILVFGGKTGWFGQKVVELIIEKGHEPVCAQSRLENRESIIAEIQRVKPDFIINTAGITGKPNVDWCETNREETVRVNVLGALNLADITFQHNIHLTHFTTGCIYYYDENHPLGSGKGFTEEDEPNFKGSFYSKTKILAEKLMLEYPNVLNLRVKMPVSSDLNDRSFIGKIARFKKVVNIPNSLCVIDDLFPIAVDMTLKKVTGNYNFVNPGAISHHEILELYKKYIDPNHTYEGFTLEEQAKVLKVGRSNAELDVSKLLKLYPHLPHIKDSIHQVFARMKGNVNYK